MVTTGEEANTFHVPLESELPNGVPLQGGAARVFGPGRGLVVRLAVLPCPSCHSQVYTIHHAGGSGSRPHFWRLDTRQIAVRCPDCKHVFSAFAYPLLNWVPISRVILGVAGLNGFVGLLLLSAFWQ